MCDGAAAGARWGPSSPPLPPAEQATFMIEFSPQRSSGFQRSTLLLNCTTWMNLEDILLNETSQIQRTNNV